MVKFLLKVKVLLHPVFFIYFITFKIIEYGEKTEI